MIRCRAPRAGRWQGGRTGSTGASLSARLQATVIGPRRAALRDILARGVARGELSEDAVSLDLAVDFAFGTMWYRLLSHHAPVDQALATEITTALRRLLDPPPDA